MDNREFEELGDKIQDIIEKAVNSQDYKKLNQNISQTVNKAIDNGSEALKDALNNAFDAAQRGIRAGGEATQKAAEEAYKRYRYQPPESFRRQQVEPKQETSLALYSKNTGIQVRGVLKTVFGSILTGTMGVGLAVSGICQLVGAVGSVWTDIIALMGVGTVVGVGLLASGCRQLGKLGRFRKYVKTMGEHTYCNFDQLSRAVGKPLKYVKKDVKAMISKGWFLEGHVDRQETCLITSNETYRQYVQTQKQLEMKRQEEEKKKEERAGIPPEVQEVLDKGNEYLEKIRKSNDAIPGEEISSKISRMELIVEKIFERAQEHPEVIPDLKRLMNYYLPMTIKLLDAYEDMDQQPVQGENIRSSKKEIEDTLDTLNIAFEKLLDSIFKDTAWDVSSDILVLHSVLAQEGLTEDDFQKMRRESKEKQNI